jgi:hypothetical protein
MIVTDDGIDEIGTATTVDGTCVVGIGVHGMVGVV